MGVSGGPYIVRDSSLVLELDAADRNSYVSGSLIWNDNSGNGNSGSLVNGPTFSSANGGSIVCDGVDDYIASINLNSSTFTNITIQVWVYPKNIGTGSGYIAVFDTPQRQLSLWIGNGFYGIGEIQSYYYGNFNWTNNVWCFITLMKSGSLGMVIKNNYEEAASLPEVGSTFTQQLQIGSNVTGGGEKFNGNYGSIMIYNRALSQSEISQNYNAQKSRFGLK